MIFTFFILVKKDDLKMIHTKYVKNVCCIKILFDLIKISKLLLRRFQCVYSRIERVR